MRWTAFLRAIDPRTLARHAHTVEALRASNKALRQDVRLLRQSLADLTQRLETTRTLMDQLAAVQADEAQAAEQLDRLADVLDRDRVAAHVLAAVAAAGIADTPAPHMSVAGLLPAEVYAALVTAIPPAVFFERRDDARDELRLPPRLSSTPVLAAWTFVADVVDHILAPALVARFATHFEDALGRPAATSAGGPQPRPAYAVDRSRLVSRRPGASATGSLPPWPCLTIVLPLMSAGDSEGDASVVRAAEDTTLSRSMPHRANDALVVMTPPGTHQYQEIPASAPGGARISYECRIDPDAATRRRLSIREGHAP